MNTYILSELIIKGIEPKIINQIIDEILKITLPVKDDYPDYKNWYLNTHIPGIGINRDIIFTVLKNKIVGIANIKIDEKKICTLYIRPGYRANKIGTELVKKCMDVLGTNKPLITISSNKLHLFQKIIKQNNWEYSEALSNYYTSGSDEYVFNGSLYLPKEKSEKKLILSKQDYYFHIKFFPKKTFYQYKNIFMINFKSIRKHF